MSDKCDNYEICDNYSTYGMCDSDTPMLSMLCKPSDKQIITILASIDDKLTQLLQDRKDS